MYLLRYLYSELKPKWVWSKMKISRDVWGIDFIKKKLSLFFCTWMQFFFFFPKYQQTNSPNKPPLHWPGSYEGCKCINVNVVSPAPRSFISDQSLAPALWLPIGPCKPLLSAWCPLNLSLKLSKKKKKCTSYSHLYLYPFRTHYQFIPNNVFVFGYMASLHHEYIV